MTPGARSIVDEVAAHYGLDPGLLISPCRVERVFRARIEVAKRLRAIGYSMPRIGKVLNKDHTSIVYYLGRGKKKPKPPKWRAPRVRHLSFNKQMRKPPRTQRRYYLRPYAGAYWPEYEWKERQVHT